MYQPWHEAIILELIAERMAEFERRQRRGEFRLLADASATIGSERAGLLSQALLKTADALVSLGLRLRIRVDNHSATMVVPIGECIGDTERQGWCVCPARQG